MSYSVYLRRRVSVLNKTVPVIMVERVNGDGRNWSVGVGVVRMDWSGGIE